MLQYAKYHVAWSESENRWIDGPFTINDIQTFQVCRIWGFGPDEPTQEESIDTLEDIEDILMQEDGIRAIQELLHDGLYYSRWTQVYPVVK